MSFWILDETSGLREVFLIKIKNKNIHTLLAKRSDQFKHTENNKRKNSHC